LPDWQPGDACRCPRSPPWLPSEPLSLELRHIRTVVDVRCQGWLRLVILLIILGDECVQQVDDLLLASGSGIELAARRLFGWASRDPRPRSVRDHDGTFIGWGMATAAHGTGDGEESSVRVVLGVDGTATVQSAAHDIGSGPYTVPPPRPANGTLGTADGYLPVAKAMPARRISYRTLMGLHGRPRSSPAPQHHSRTATRLARCSPRSGSPRRSAGCGSPGWSVPTRRPRPWAHVASEKPPRPASPPRSATPSTTQPADGSANCRSPRRSCRPDVDPPCLLRLLRYYGPKPVAVSNVPLGTVTAAHPA
jgi:hypothetical protein